jgi:hypothetical protein
MNTDDRTAIIPIIRTNRIESQIGMRKFPLISIIAATNPTTTNPTTNDPVARAGRTFPDLLE